MSEKLWKGLRAAGAAYDRIDGLRYATGFHVLRDLSHVAGPYETEQGAWSWLHANKSSSVEWSCKHEGYAIVEIRPCAYDARTCPKHPGVPALVPSLSDLCGPCLLG